MRNNQEQVERLRRIVDETMDGRAKDQAAYQSANSRRIALDAEPHVQKEMHFYCREHGDYVADAIKVEFNDQGGHPSGYFKPFGRAQFIDARTRQVTIGTSCNHARRFITDKHLDPFYGQSKMLARLRVEMADDLLQPGDVGFEAKYGDPYKEANERRDAQERQEWQNNKQRY